MTCLMYKSCDENKLNFFVSKTKLSKFLRSIGAKNVPVRFLNGEYISILHEALKVLGIIHESSLRWTTLSNEKFRKEHIG